MTGRRASVIREYVNLRESTADALDAVQAWPRELSQPIVQQAHEVWAKFDRPPLGAPALQPLRDVLAFAESIARELKTLRLEMVSGDAELCELAERCARMCGDYPQAAEFIVKRIGLEVPNGRHMTDTGKLLRMQCVRWWRRRMRAHFGQAVENAMRARGYVCKGKAAYCTDWALRRRTSQRQRTQTMLQAAVADNEIGEQISLFDAVQASVSNPVNRRNELMTRIRGFEELATERGHIALFGTLTAPSCYHAQHAGGGENELFKTANRPTVASAQQWLCRMWARARAKLARLSIALYGFRIAEPHHDGTPHWHALFFLPAHQADTLRKVVGDVWLSEHASEKGAAKYRVQFKKINPALGDAAGYVAKYVAKNIDGFQVGEDHETRTGGEGTGQYSTTTAHRVDAWASTHRIRQFQQIGGAPVGIWRELRRLRGISDVATIHAASMHADDGDWCGFTKASQGIALWKDQTGECNAYREVAQPRVIGVQYGVHQLRTRLHEWRVRWNGQRDVHGVAGTARCKDAANGSAFSGHPSESARAALPSLGPVSITVRSENRGDGLMVYQHAGKWHAHRAISISDAMQKPPDRIGFTYDGRQFCHMGGASWKS